MREVGDSLDGVAGVVRLRRRWEEEEREQRARRRGDEMRACACAEQAEEREKGCARIPTTRDDQGRGTWTGNAVPFPPCKGTGLDCAVMC